MGDKSPYHKQIYLRRNAYVSSKAVQFVVAQFCGVLEETLSSHWILAFAKPPNATCIIALCVCPDNAEKSILLFWQKMFDIFCGLRYIYVYAWWQNRKMPPL